MNIEDCIKSCPPGVDIAKWVEQNWKPKFLGSLMEELEKISDAIRIVRGLETAKCANCKKEIYFAVVEEYEYGYFCSWECNGEFHKKLAQNTRSS